MMTNLSKTTFLKRKIFFILVFVIVPISTVLGQTAPVHSQTIMTAPYTHNLNSWTNGNPNKINLRLRLLDATTVNAQLSIKMILESNNIRIENPKALPIVTTLSGSEDLVLNASDLQIFLVEQNLSFSGLNYNEFARNGNNLPDGTYRVWFEVFETLSQTKVSFNEIPAIINLISAEPPLINYPYNNTTVYSSDNNIYFQWTARHTNSANFNNTEYTFELFEIPTNFNGDIENNLNSFPRVVNENTTNTQLIYEAHYPELSLNATYAFRIRVQCGNNAGEYLYFKNNGYSEVFIFNYKQDCKPLISTRVGSTTYNSAIIIWTSSLDAISYKVMYRKYGIEDANWFTTTVNSTNTEVFITDLEEGTKYEYKVACVCSHNISENNISKSFTTKRKEDLKTYDCGNHDETNPITNKNPLYMLQRFDVISTKAGFNVSVAEITSGENGYFYGNGYISIPIFSNIKLKVKFSNIFVNELYELVSGEFVAEKSRRNI